ncbi:hypothetical protein TRVA0_061S00606 [Trichomonascus vanleenenianus]|uniref:uncharacterized protein n=1 Tax=Trichomonascus vanleenenianus TaxID=2268995 RepID=UPI003ECB6DAA
MNGLRLAAALLLTLLCFAASLFTFLTSSGSPVYSFYTFSIDFRDFKEDLDSLTANKTQKPVDFYDIYHVGLSGVCGYKRASSNATRQAMITIDNKTYTRSCQQSTIAYGLDFEGIFEASKLTNVNFTSAIVNSSDVAYYGSKISGIALIVNLIVLALTAVGGIALIAIYRTKDIGVFQRRVATVNILAAALVAISAAFSIAAYADLSKAVTNWDEGATAHIGTSVQAALWIIFGVSLLSSAFYYFSWGPLRAEKDVY